MDISTNIKNFIENYINDYIKDIDQQSFNKEELFDILEHSLFCIEYKEIPDLINIFSNILEMENINKLRDELIAEKIIRACTKWQFSSSKNKSEIKLRDLINRYTNRNFYGLNGKSIEQFCTRINHPTFKFIPASGHRKRLYVQYIG